MERIASFTVDHNKLEPGIYVSRIDGDITTYDLRLKKPNNGDYLTGFEMHTFEHMFATFVRNSEIKDSVIYFGPMGCLTGFYLLIRNADNEVVLKETLKILDKIISYEGPVFGASPVECGNYKMLELESSKIVAREYKRIFTEKVQTFEY